MANFIISYTTPANYTYDSDKISVESGLAKLKDLRPQDATFGANYNADINGNYGNGVLTGIAYSGASVSGGKLDLTGLSGKYITYEGTDNAPGLQTGCIRFKLTPNYSGNPSQFQYFFEFYSNWIYNSMHLYNVSDRLYIQIRDSAGNIFLNSNFGIWSPTQGQEYEFEFNYDFTVGQTRLFIDGVQMGNTISSTGTRTSQPIIKIGRDFNGSGSANFSIDDFQLFSTVQHTSNYTPGYTVTNIYSIDKPTIYKTSGNSLADIQEWISFSETVGAGNSGSIRYQLSGNGTDWLYWNGSFWATAGASDYNTEAECEAHMLDFTTSYDKIYVKAFLISNGEQQVELDENQIGYVVNTAPSVYAGLNKTAIYNTNMTPFSDCLFSDAESNIVKAEWKVDGGNYTEISQGAYSTLLEAVRAFTNAFTHSGNKNVYLKITDSYDAYSDDILIINVNQVTVTINVQDSKNHHIPNVTWDAGDGSASSTQSSPFSYTYNINTWTATLSKNYFDSLSESNTISISITELNFIMSQETRIDELITNIDAPVYFVLGDTVTLKGQVNTNLTNYKIRCQIYDATGNTIKLATSNSGGADSQIEIINASTGEFIILCAKDLTDGFKNDITIEVEIENSSGQVRTIFKNNFHFENDNLTWTDPSI